MTLRKTSLVWIAMGTTGLLSIPLLLMATTNAVNWKVGDFLIGGAILFSAGILFDIMLQSIRRLSHRIVIGLLIVAVTALIWAELAVGLIENLLTGSLR